MRLACLFLLTALVSTQGFAEFHLESEGYTKRLFGPSRYKASIQFSYNPVAFNKKINASSQLMIPPAELKKGEESDYYWLKKSKPKDSKAEWMVTSCLIATPGLYNTQASDWTLEWQILSGTSKPTPETKKALWVEPVRVGSMPGVQIFLDRSKLGVKPTAPGEEIEIQIDLQGPNQPARKVRGVPKSQFPEAARIFETAFLNGNRLQELPVSPPKPLASFPKRRLVTPKPHGIDTTPTPSLTPTPSITPSPSTTPTITLSPTPSPTPSPSPSSTILPRGTTPLFTPLFTNTPTPSLTATPLIVVTLTPSPSVTPTQSPTLTPSLTPSPIPTIAPQPADFRMAYTRGNHLLKIDLEEIGSSLENLDQFRLSYHGTTIPVGGTLEGNEVWCYAPRTHTLTDIHDAVFATTSTLMASTTITTRSAFSTLSSQATEVSIQRCRTFGVNGYNSRYERSVPRPPRERFVRNRISSGQNSSITFPLRDALTDPNIDISIEVLGFSEFSEFAPDHFADFSLGGVVIPRVSWDGRVLKEIEETVTLPAIPTGTNIVLEHSIPAGSPFESGATDFQTIDIIKLTWQGRPRTNSIGQTLIELEEAPDSMPRRIAIGGYALGTTIEDIILLDITDDRNPVRLTGAPIFADDTGGLAIEFEAPGTASRFFAQTISSIKAPDFTVPIVPLPEALPSDTYLFGVYVRDPIFEDELAPLIALRGSENIIEIDPQAAYDAYNHGQESPEALHKAISDIVANSPLRIPLPWILLVGHGSLDPRNYLKQQSGPQIPPFVELGVSTSLATFGSFNIEMPTDYTYGLLEGQDTILDAIVGRIPAKTEAELTIAVNRILDHEVLDPLLSALPRTGLFVTDNQFDFEQDTPTWIELWERGGKPSETITIADGLGSETDRIGTALEASDGGSLFLLYIGHGNINLWADERIMDNTKAIAIDTNNQWPTIAALTCLNGYYAFPGGSATMAETWLFADDDRGAIANVAPSAVDFYVVLREFIHDFMSFFALSDNMRPKRVGELFTRAQIQFSVNIPFKEGTVHAYHLFGDPASTLTLGVPPPASVEEWVIY